MGAVSCFTLSDYFQANLRRVVTALRLTCQFFTTNDWHSIFNNSQKYVELTR
jgi:hypothetical protein